MRTALLIIVSLSVASLACSGKQPSQPPKPSTAPVNGLLPAAAFAQIHDDLERSAELFAEAAKVLTHPRCANCHPADDRPRQGDASLEHRPPVWGGAEGRGVPAAECTSCHQKKNFTELAIPGAPDWHLARPTMVFLGASAGAICVGLKDPAKNGGKTIAEVVDHVRHDGLVAWGYAPGPGRNSPPGDVETLVGLLAAWAEAGAGCPGDDR